VKKVEGMAVSIIRGSTMSEVVFKYTVEECTLLVTIKIPLNYPLRQVEVQGISMMIDIKLKVETTLASLNLDGGDIYFR